MVACVHVPMVVVVVLELVTVVGVMLVLLDVAGTVEVDDEELVGGGDVELVVLELVELDVLVPPAWVVLVVPIEVEVVAVVVDVLVVEPAQASVSVTRSLMTFRAKNAPTRVASWTSFKTPSGSVSPVTQIVPFTTAWRATVTLAFEKSWT